ncbi:MAG TPA: WGxxGxxG family protein [Candidatus Sericytochromatia bacterium]
MKISNITKFVGASVLAASVAVVPLNLPASAQSNTGSNTTTDTTTTTAPTQGVDNTSTDDGFDWGWLGLLGLGGLAGLLGRKHQEPVAYRDPNEVGSTTYRQ